MQSENSGHFSAEMLIAYGVACTALARAQERLARFPEPGVLMARLRMADQDALAWLEGETFIPEQLALDYGTSPHAWRRWPFTFVRVFNRKIAGGDRPSAANIANWINPRVQAKTPSPAPANEPLALDLDRLKRFSQNLATTTTTPALIAGADRAASFVRFSPLVQGNVVVGTMLAEQLAIGTGPLSAGGLAAIGLKAGQIAWKALLAGGADEEADDLSDGGDTTRARLAWLEALAAGATQVITASDACQFWLMRLEDLCATGRKTSYMRDVCHLAVRSPSLTATRVAAELGISRQAADSLMRRAYEHRILREVTYGAAFRRYVADF